MKVSRSLRRELRHHQKKSTQYGEQNRIIDSQYTNVDHRKKGQVPAPVCTMCGMNCSVETVFRTFSYFSLNALWPRIRPSCIILVNVVKGI